MPVFENGTFEPKSDEVLNRMKPEATVAGLATIKPAKAMAPDWQETAMQGVHDAIMQDMASAYNRTTADNFEVIKSIGIPTLSQMNAQFGGGNMMVPQIAKDISLTSPLTSSNVAFQGFTPIDLRRPARLLYPIYSPLRNRLPRVKGEGSAYNLKRVLSISGAGIFGAKTLNPFQTEIPSGQSFTNWPMTGDYTPVVLSADQPQVPYRIMKIDQSASWFSYFAGMGYEDVVGLTTLTLLQSMMAHEERAIISAQSTVLGTPSASITGTPRSPLGTETALAGGTVWVSATSVNMFGESTASAAVAAGTATSSQVLDLKLGTDVTGTMGYNIYAAYGGTVAPATLYFQGFTAWNHLTLQGTLNTSGDTAPASDTGTGASSNYNGLIPILAGNANSIYDPSSLGVNTGYTYRHNGLNGGTPVAFGVTDLNNAFIGMYDTSYADPDEIWMNALDRINLANAALTNANGFQSLRIFVDQDEVGGVRAGAVVPTVYNPVTGKAVKLTVHPYMIQGNAVIMSYQLPMSYSEVPNVAQIVNLQDYMSVAWPVVDVRYKFSILLYGSFVMEAPQFCGLIQGIPKSASQPYS